MVNRALIVILATVTLDAVGIGLALPVIPSLLRELSHETRIAGRFGYFMAIYPFMQFLFSPVLGRLSDRFGRHPPYDPIPRPCDLAAQPLGMTSRPSYTLRGHE